MKTTLTNGDALEEIRQPLKQELEINGGLVGDLLPG